MESERYVAWEVAPGTPGFSVTLPFDGRAASVGNGSMTALSASGTQQVDAVHARALSLGGIDEGAPGPRGEGFYACYFRDLDGNKLSVFCMT
jgi:predicted lactoylglutathione lyase